MSAPAQSARFIPQAVVIALAPALAYAAAFAYEAGFLRHFGLPLWLIDLRISSILGAGAGLLSIAAGVYWVAVLVPTRVRELYPFARALALSAIPTVLFIGYLLSASPRWWWGSILLLWSLTAVWLFLVQPLFDNRTPAGVLSKYQRAYDGDLEKMPEPLAVPMLRWLSGLGYDVKGLFALGACICLGLTLANKAGANEAARQRVYLATSGNPTQVALRSYGELIVVGVVNRAEPTRIVAIRLIAKGADGGVEWHLAPVGPFEATVSDSNVAPLRVPTSQDLSGDSTRTSTPDRGGVTPP